MREVEILPAAEKDIRRLDKKTAERILDKLDWLAKNPSVNLPPLKSSPITRAKLSKFRVGAYRVLLTIESDTIIVYRVGHRREVYDWL